MLQRARRKTATDVTFVLPSGYPCGPVSVVGDFNEWLPGAHPLVERADGTRAVKISMPSGQRVHFRYLADGGHWFDDPDADGHDGHNCFVDN